MQRGRTCVHMNVISIGISMKWKTCLLLLLVVVISVGARSHHHKEKHGDIIEPDDELDEGEHSKEHEDVSGEEHKQHKHKEDDDSDEKERTDDDDESDKDDDKIEDSVEDDFDADDDWFDKRYIKPSVGKRDTPPGPPQDTGKKTSTPPPKTTAKPAGKANKADDKKSPAKPSAQGNKKAAKPTAKQGDSGSVKESGKPATQKPANNSQPASNSGTSDTTSASNNTKPDDGKTSLEFAEPKDGVVLLAKKLYRTMEVDILNKLKKEIDNHGKSDSEKEKPKHMKRKKHHQRKHKHKKQKEESDKHQSSEKKDKKSKEEKNSHESSSKEVKDKSEAGETENSSHEKKEEDDEKKGMENKGHEKKVEKLTLDELKEHAGLKGKHDEKETKKESAVINVPEALTPKSDDREPDDCLSYETIHDYPSIFESNHGEIKAAFHDDDHTGSGFLLKDADDADDPNNKVSAEFKFNSPVSLLGIHFEKADDIEGVTEVMVEVERVKAGKWSWVKGDKGEGARVFLIRKSGVKMDLISQVSGVRIYPQKWINFPIIPRPSFVECTKLDNDNKKHDDKLA